MRFAVLHHTGWPGRADHFDLLLETQSGDDADEAALMAWATVGDAFPSGTAPGCELVPLAPHRRLYLQYEGEIAGGRGKVARVDEGILNFVSQPDDNKVHEWKLALWGQQLRGEFVIVRTADARFSFQKTDGDE